MRLNKFLASAGVASRRECDKIISEGKVTVNGKTAVLGVDVAFDDEVTVNGQKVVLKKNEYYILNKPKGYICSVSDDKGRKTVLDLMPQGVGRIYPVGRLDYDTTGILILTNDGELSNILTHPSRDVPKEYYAKVKGFFKKEDALKLSEGIVLNGVKTKKALFKMKKYDKKADVSYVKVIITEGRNHQVKDMFASFNYDTLKLKRERYAGLDLLGLKSGEYRKLSVKEVKQLYSNK